MDSINGDMLRGHLETLVLSVLERGEAHGMEILRRLEVAASGVLRLKEGSLYPALYRLEAAGKQLIDTTCPLVTRVHEAARQFERSGHHVIVLGRPGHVEVRGIVGDLASYSIVASIADVRTWPFRKLGVIAQSMYLALINYQCPCALRQSPTYLRQSDSWDHFATQ